MFEAQGVDRQCLVAAWLPLCLHGRPPITVCDRALEAFHSGFGTIGDRMGLCRVVARFFQ